MEEKPQRKFFGTNIPIPCWNKRKYVLKSLLQCKKNFVFFFALSYMQPSIINSVSSAISALFLYHTYLIGVNCINDDIFYRI